MLIRNVCLFVNARGMYYPTVSMHQRERFVDRHWRFEKKVCLCRRRDDVLN